MYMPKMFEYVKINLQEVTQEANLTLIPVYTNIRCLDDDWTFWKNEFEGAVCALIAHALVPRFSAVSMHRLIS